MGKRLITRRMVRRSARAKKKAATREYRTAKTAATRAHRDKKRNEYYSPRRVKIRKDRRANVGKVFREIAGHPLTNKIVDIGGSLLSTQAAAAGAKK